MYMRKILTLALALLMLVSLVGCGTDAPAQTTEPVANEDAVDTTAAAVDTPEDTTAAQAPEAQPVEAVYSFVFEGVEPELIAA